MNSGSYSSLIWINLCQRASTFPAIDNFHKSFLLVLRPRLKYFIFEKLFMFSDKKNRQLDKMQYPICKYNQIEIIQPSPNPLPFTPPDTELVLLYDQPLFKNDIAVRGLQVIYTLWIYIMLGEGGTNSN